MELTLKDRKLINNGGIPELEQRLEDKIASTAIPLEGTTGLSTLTDRKYIKNLPKFNDGLNSFAMDKQFNYPGTPSVRLSGLTTNGSITSALNQPVKLTDTASDAIKALPTGGNVGGGFGKTLGSVVGVVGAGAGAAQNIIGAIDFAGSIANGTKYNKTADGLLQDAGSSEGNIGGVSYQTLNDINASQVAAQEHAENKANTIGLMGKGASLGASIGSVAGPVGGLIGGAVGAIGGLVGGLFGGGKRHAAMRRRIAEAQDRALRQNDFSRNGALTSVLLQNYAREYGDTESQSLYGFKEGKEGAINPLTMTTVKNHIVETSHGKDYGPLNSWTEKDEVIWDTKNDPAGLNMHIVDHGPNDGARSFLTDSDAVFSRKGNMNLKALANAGNPIGLQAILNEQADMKQRKNKGLFAAKCGKLPGFDGGKWGVPEWANLTGNLIPLIATDIEYNKAKSLPLGSYTATHSNPNASISSNMMSQRRYNPYQSYRDVWDLYAKNNYASNNNGLSSSQRNLLRTTNYANTLDTIFKINDHAQLMNNQYLGENAQFLDNQGRFNAQLRQTDDIKRYDTYTQSHGALSEILSRLSAQKNNIFLNFVKGVADLDFYRYMKNMFDADRNADNANRAAKYKLNQPAVVKNPDIYNYNLGIPASSKYEQAVANNVAKYFQQPAAQSMEEKLLIPDLPMFNFSANMFKKGSVSRKAAKKGGRK